ncbi:MAG: response regulator transcription factor [Chromatiales bacterium]|jgi:two-component system response regulator AlgR
MNILIVDDEAPARARLRGLLEELDGDWHVAAEAATGRDALRRCAELAVDVVLLDIRMPDMDGLEAAAALARQETPPAVIFTTAYAEHALDAFEEQAVDYLLKPVRAERLARALERVRSFNRAQVSALARRAGEEGYVCANFRGGLQRVPVEEVLYFRADQKYVTACHGQGELLLEESLKSLEQRFADRFLRIHRNALVSHRCLAGLERDADGRSFVRLRDRDDRLEVSRRHLPLVRRWLRDGA